MTPSEYCAYDAIGLAKLVRDRDISQKELAETVSAAIDALNPEINAVIEQFDDRIDSLSDFPDDSDAPFAGVPWLLKDVGTGEVGRLQEQGCRLLKGCVVEEATHLANQMQKAGLVSLGRTAIPECAYDGNTESILQGSTRNPWDLSLSAGGSSGGASASVAAGIVPAAHASDGAGSIRIPASYNGQIGLKPTRGRISTWPVFIADRPLGHATEFIVCNTARDAAGMLDAFHGPAPAEPQTLPTPELPFQEAALLPIRKLKVAISWDNGGPCDCHPAIITAIKSAASHLEREGHAVEEAYPKLEFDLIANAMTDLWAIEIATMLKYYGEALKRPLDDTTLEPNLLGLMERSKGISGQEMMEALQAQDVCSLVFHDFLTDYDILITPTTCTPAPKLGQTGPFTPEPWVIDFAAPHSAQIMQYTIQANASGQPAISLPLGWTDDGLPVGVQIQARYGDEATLLQLATYFENAMPWSEKRAPLHFSKQS